MAQYVEVVHLKNGSMIKGVIIEQTPNKSIKIQTSDGSIFVYSYDEIEKITKEALDQRVRNPYTNPSFARPPHRPSYMGMVDFGYSIDVSGTSAGRAEISTSHGCLAIPYLYLGAGVGFQYYHSESLFSIPIFADFRGYPKRGDYKPFFNFRIGYAAGDITGLYLSPSVGVSLKRFDISLGYTLQKAEVLLGGYYYGYWETINVNGLTLKCGVRF